jgi:hypothetical protein
LTVWGLVADLCGYFITTSLPIPDYVIRQVTKKMIVSCKSKHDRQSDALCAISVLVIVRAGRSTVSTGSTAFADVTITAVAAVGATLREIEPVTGLRTSI